MSVITEDRIARAEQISQRVLLTYLETGALPEGEAPISREEAEAELRALYERHRPALVGAGVQFVGDLVRATLLRTGLSAAELAEMSDAQLAQLEEAAADQVAALRERVEARRQLVLDLQATGLVVARRALVGGLLAVL